ncbi:MAG TPA: DEAD/DEAH box helicase [Candidatus Sulfomarinibacteraceae bacterium]|nr:DEAD/DEAH box helicase [Candidatus Sulfomarinibacteraceae bacterium]
MSFDQLGLSPELLRAVADQGYTEPTPIQAQAIPHVLAGRDVLAGAQTGTGKTAAFVLPILQRLHAVPAPQPMAAALASRPGHAPRPGGAPRRLPRVLVLVPTRELALQVEESVRTYGARRPVRSVPIYGGVGYEPQFRGLRSGPEIVVATPGRLLDHINQRTVDLSAVEVLVLDEADRMLDMGFIRDIRKILETLPAQRQNLLFSATFNDDIRSLAAGFLRDPAHVQATPRNTATALVRQVVIRVDRERKRDLLRELVASGRIDQALVFARTKHGANRLAEQLVKDGITAAAIHGNRSQSQRIRALTDFKAGRVSILVATEVAARGIDIEELPHVINFELPMAPEDYLHRIGRTGRAGIEGDAISFVCVDEDRLLRDIEVLLGRRIDVEIVPGYEPDRSIRPQPIRLRTVGAPAPRPAHGVPSPDRGSVGFGTRPGAARPHRGTAGRRPGAPVQGRPLAPSHGRPHAPAPTRPMAPWRPGAAATSRPPGGAGRSGGGGAIQAGGPSNRPVAMPGERLARHGERPWGRSS